MVFNARKVSNMYDLMIVTQVQSSCILAALYADVLLYSQKDYQVL